MGHVFCCWELGAGYGHLYRLLPIVEALTRAGHKVSLVSRDIERARPIFKPLGIPAVSAPAWSAPGRSFPLSINYAQNLFRNGYWHSPSLQQRLKDWLAIFDEHQPDLVLAEHAPTALLAARLANLPRAVTGTGFSIPPRLSPMPGIQPWFKIPEHHLQKTERTFLDTLNPVLKSLGGKKLATVAEIFDQAECFLCTFRELDHYSIRETTDHLGPILYTPDNQVADWPDFDGAHVFLYMQSGNRMVRPVLSLLKELPVSVLAFIPAMPAEEISLWSSNNIRILSHPVNLAEIARSCKLMISQGGTNAGIYMLLHGVPLFLLPLELEQMLWAYRLSQQELAATVNFYSSQPRIETHLRNILESDTISKKAKKFSKDHANYDPRQTVQFIVDKCSAMIDY